MLRRLALALATVTVLSITAFPGTAHGNCNTLVVFSGTGVVTNPNPASTENVWIKTPHNSVGTFFCSIMGDPTAEDPFNTPYNDPDFQLIHPGSNYFHVRYAGSIPNDPPSINVTASGGLYSGTITLNKTCHVNSQGQCGPTVYDSNLIAISPSATGTLTLQTSIAPFGQITSRYRTVDAVLQHKLA